MKLLISLFVLLLSLNSFSHCGACGEGEASDHQEKGEESGHHDNDKESKADTSEEDKSEEESDSDD